MKTINLKTESPRILVIKLKHIGDVLMATPSIAELRERFPGAFISVLVRKGTEDMVKENPKIDKVITYGGFRESPVFKKIIKEIGFAFELRKKRFDIVVEMGFGDREAIYGFVSGAPVRMGFDPGGEGFPGRGFIITHKFPMDYSLHIVERDLGLLRPLGISNSMKGLELYYRDEDAEFARRVLEENRIGDEDLIILMHPTSRWLFKCWTDEGNAGIADYFQKDKGAKVIMTSGPESREIEKAEHIMGLMKTKPISLFGNITLKQLAALIDTADLFIGVDSAPMHMAAALKTPVIALFGPSGEHNWAPRGEGHTVIKKDMPCRPCGRAGCNDSKRSECLEAIALEDVIPSIEKKIIEIRERRTFRRHFEVSGSKG